jgi:hypothetical protein
MQSKEEVTTGKYKGVAVDAKNTHWLGRSA